MTNNTDKTPGETKHPVIESGFGVFFLAWAKAIGITAAIILILRYIFHIKLLF